MGMTKLFQAPIEPEASLVSKREGRVIHISFDGQRFPRGKIEMSPILPIICGKECTSIDMPLGTAIHNIEITLGKDGQLARAAGAVVKLIANEGKSATLKLPSGEVRLISKNCSATKSLGRVGSKCWLGKCPIVRGVVMNPIDHPHGGGEGRDPIGRKKNRNPLGLSCTWKK
uniref:Large ribosomal subunit protein uL2 C-terminal domain-containing protein n=1 Tax=Gossypium raimondii TaxID=29730 RepID=A0A0D2NP19_GOSRA|nr:hypothetical protein B456_002G165900 [Gossypium raimondii]